VVARQLRLQVGQALLRVLQPRVLHQQRRVRNLCTQAAGLVGWWGLV
jgi:hypothetical protein